MTETILQYLLYAVLAYLVIINVIAFFTFGWDKRKAKKDQWRTPEKKLMHLAVIGGSIGAMIGMKVFHHKTRKMKFSVGIPVIFVIQAVVAIGIIYYIVR